MVNVLKRDGSIVPLDILRIRKVVDWACKRFDVNPLALEAGLTTRLKDGISTREIQDNLISVALEMCDLDNPDWRYVAGRLHVWSLWKDTQAFRGYQYGNYLQTVIRNTNEGVYDSTLHDVYSYKELDRAEQWINPDWDLDYDYAGAVMLTSRYLLENELIQEAFLSCALILASNENPSNRLEIAKEIYEAIAKRKISLATPILANLRSKASGSVSSCFITSMDDNLESIFAEVTNFARISKNGGGAGVNVSKVRAAGSSVMGKRNTSGGVIPWMKLLNDTAIAVNQGGRRAGAVTVSLDIWHLDIPEFLEIQHENGDQRRKCYDLFPQLVICDEFMRRVRDKEEWTLVDPYEVKTKLGIELAELWGEEFEKQYQLVECSVNYTLKLYKKVNARDLFKDIMRSQLETGLPYLWFKDTCNASNPNKHDGYIPGGNLCQESWSNVKSGELAHCCNLVSLNLATIKDIELSKYCQLAVRILDNTIELTQPPFKEAEDHNQRYRTIGVGCMGLADWLASRKLSYSNLNKIDELFEDFAYYCTSASMELAKDRGSYPAFEGSEWSKGLLMGCRDTNWIINNASKKERWLRLSKDIKKYGIRNSHITAIAPNTSSSLVQGATASILPVYSKFFYDKWAKGSVPIAPPFIKEYQWFYKENKNTNQNEIINAVATMQKWIDTGISMELVFNLNEGIYDSSQPGKALNAVDIFNTLMLAWIKGCKAIYYIRTIQKDTYKEKEECSSCAN